MRDAIQEARWFVGVVWFLSWFELYLEIYRHHHVRPSDFLSPLSWWVSGASGRSRPGGWLLADLACSVLAPTLFVFLLLWSRLLRGRPGHSSAAFSEAPFPIALAAMVIGSVLCVLATINQLIRRSPIDLDFTLRKGNFGFIVLGVTLVLVGLLLARLKISSGAQQRTE